MDPPTSPESNEPPPTSGRGRTNSRNIHVRRNSLSPDPPEERFETPSRTPFRQFSNKVRQFRQAYRPPPSSSNRQGRYDSRGNRSTRTTRPPVHNFRDDDELDEAELEGLMMTSMSRTSSTLSASTTSSVGAGRRISPFSEDLISYYFSPVIAACSLAWNPQNRARSAIGLLFIALLFMIGLEKRDFSLFKSASTSGHTDAKQQSNKYKNRKEDPLSKLTSDQRHSLLTSMYGSWGFYDGSADDRPTEPYMTVEKAGPFLDLKEEDFPQESWQVDAVYVNHFLDAATKLVRRAQDAIFATYHGYGLEEVIVDDGDVKGIEKDHAERTQQRTKMFHLEELDFSTVTSKEELESKFPDWKTKGGWTTPRSMDGLERRLLHSMMTNSNFTIVVTGSWQSMGYGGNHGWQSVSSVLESLLGGIFEKLGVKLVVRGIGLPSLSESSLALSKAEEAELMFGGRSTLISALGWSDIYGSDVDMVIWDDYSLSDNDNDSDETSAQLYDLFARQALLSGDTTLPFLWGGDFEVLRYLHDHADADVGELGNGMWGIPETSSEKIVGSLPWAAQYLNCSKKMESICGKEEIKFMSQCWVERADVTPPTTQLEHIPTQPTAIGWRMHQLKGYTTAYNLLAALLDALNTWSEKTIYEGHPLADDYWHMEDYVKNAQSKIKELTTENAPHCFELYEKMDLPQRLCQNRMRGRTEYTPRAHPTETSVVSIVATSADGGLPLFDKKMVYEGEDIENPVARIPDGEVDALEIINLTKQRRRRMKLEMQHLAVGSPFSWRSSLFSLPSISSFPSLHSNFDVFGDSNTISINGGQTETHNFKEYRRKMENIEAGVGWKVVHSLPGQTCDGSLSSSVSCGRSSSSNCLMEGHQGSRGGVWGNESTGWLIMHVKDLRQGFIALNLEVGSRAGDFNSEVGDGGKTRLLRAMQTGNKELSANQRVLNEELPDAFVFEYAIDGTISTLDKSKFLEKLKHHVSGMGLLTILDDSTRSSDDIQVAVRVRGCSEAQCQVAVTHVYWS